jgi:hypothetical protein
VTDVSIGRGYEGNKWPGAAGGAHQCVSMEVVVRSQKLPASTEVPGGVVTTVVRWRSVIWPLLDLGRYAGGVSRDIVIRDSTGARELYREGPYNQITVNRPLNRILAEIEAEGLESFLRKRQIEQGQIGPISERSDRVSLTKATVGYERAAWSSFFHRFRR